VVAASRDQRGRNKTGAQCVNQIKCGRAKHTRWSGERKRPTEDVNERTGRKQGTKTGETPEWSGAPQLAQSSQSPSTRWKGGKGGFWKLKEKGRGGVSSWGEGDRAMGGEKTGDKLGRVS